MKSITPQVEDTSRALETKRVFLDKSGRKNRAAPIRTVFVQQGDRRHPQPGPLAALVRHHDQLALDLLLLAYAKASGHPYNVTFQAVVWARLLGLPETSPTSFSRISKAWARLEQLKLIVRGKQQRAANIVLLREDGHGDTYAPPGTLDPYFKLDFGYWLDGWDAMLSLPAKAILLIALSLRDGFILPTELASDWYGISADSIDRGLRELRRHQLLKYTTERKIALLAPAGFTQQHRYWRQPPFGAGRPGMS